MTTNYIPLTPGEPLKVGDRGDHIGGGKFEYKRPVEGDVMDGKCKNCDHEMRLPNMGIVIETIKCVKCSHIFIRGTWKSEFKRVIIEEGETND